MIYILGKFKTVFLMIDVHTGNVVRRSAQLHKNLIHTIEMSVERNILISVSSTEVIQWNLMTLQVIQVFNIWDAQIVVISGDDNGGGGGVYDDKILSSFSK